MKRGYIARKPRKRRVKGTPKSLGKSAVVKGPARDKEHLARVRHHNCIMCNAPWMCFPMEAHHVRSIVPRTMGRRVSDFLAVPLCPFCHRWLHQGNEGDWWSARRISPAEWIAQFSKEGAAEIARLNGAKSKPSDVSEDHHA